MTHYDEEALFEYVEGTSSIAGDIESHVLGCDLCSSEVGEQRAMIAELASGELWANAPAPAPRQFVVNVAAFAERARREEEDAVAICDELLAGPSNWWVQRLRNMPFAALGRGEPREGETWRVNFFRIDRHPEKGDEYSAWQPTMKNPADFHVPAAFGTIRFQG